jgi:HAMP domain-containing protein
LSARCGSSAPGQPYAQRNLPTGGAELHCPVGSVPPFVAPDRGDRPGAPPAHRCRVPFRPGAAAPLLGLSAGELTGLTVRLDDLRGAAATALGNLVCRAPSPDRSLDETQRFLVSQLNRTDPSDPLVSEAVRRLMPWHPVGWAPCRRAAAAQARRPAGHRYHRPGRVPDMSTMRERARRARPGFRLLLPRATIRLRLTLLYASLFLGSGACLLAFTYLAVAHLIGSYGFSFSAYSQGTQIGVHLPQILQTLESRQAGAEKRQLLVVSGIALAIMAAASAGLGWVMAGRVLRPLRTITTAARHISALNLGQRLALDGPDDELRELGSTFDGLLGRLQASFAAQRQFIANVSRELRTPLARQRVLTQVALADPDATASSLRAAHERVLASGAQQERLIEALLTLALSQRGFERREPVDLAAVAKRSCWPASRRRTALG